ncbi:MAG: polysaccharide biosynthesis/export family protein [Candidatus Acidiferrales bacterium]
MAPVRVTVLALFAFVLVAPGKLRGQQTNVIAKASAHAMAPDSQQQDSDRPALQRRNPRYRVNADDVLTITFPLTPEFDQFNVMVQPDGYINLQGADSLYVQGMSVPEIIQALKKAYADTLHDPIISVDLADFQRPFFLVSGQVGKPGEYDLRHETTVTEAIAIAGGFAPTAKTQVFLYHRVSDGWVEVKKLSLKDILNGKHANEDALVSSGDMIFVPEKFITNFRKYVPYSVTGAAGSYQTNP